MHPLVAQVLQMIQQAMQQGALPPEALMQLLQALQGMMQGGGGAMPPPGAGPGGMPGQPPMGADQAAMMQLLSQGG